MNCITAFKKRLSAISQALWELFENLNVVNVARSGEVKRPEIQRREKISQVSPVTKVESFSE